VNFLDARRIVQRFTGGPDLPFLFALSGTADPFRLYLEAAGAELGHRAVPTFLPFNTLHQHLAGPPTDTPVVYLVLPWDLVPETDWRSGVPQARVEVARALEGARRAAGALRRRPRGRLFYLPAPLPPVVGYAAGEEALRHGLDAIAAEMGAHRLPAEWFALGGYFASGCPVGGAWLGAVARSAVDALLAPERAAAKVLVTDLDNTLWAGVIAEEGAEGIAFRPEGAGFRHHAYQGLLGRLRREGVLLAAVSRNDAAVVLPPLRSGAMVLSEEDFVAVLASYHAKSAQIRQLALQLNLGLDAFVFVDDNPVERNEVERAMPEVRTLAFPEHDDQLPAFLDELAAHFERRELTEEDRQRTSLYRLRLEGMAPAEAAGSDLTAFLADLQMRLTMYDRTGGDRTRAVQLINKTNQFNANGRRWSDEDVVALLAKGGRLFGASLADRSGSHGEVIACLVSPDGVIESLVMSCRVFQRRAEYAFLASLASLDPRPSAVRYAITERNEPFRQFASDPAFAAQEPGLLRWDAAAFADAHAAALKLVEVLWD